MRQWPTRDAQFVEALRCHPEISTQKWAEMLHKALLLPQNAAHCRWLGSPGSQATSFCCNCSCSPRSAPRELSLPHTSWSSSADQKDFPQPCVSRCPGCLLPHGKQQTCKGHPALGQLSLDCWALLVIGLLGLLLISEIFVEILQ